jgi:hypothetical protein
MQKKADSTDPGEVFVKNVYQREYEAETQNCYPCSCAFNESLKKIAPVDQLFENPGCGKDLSHPFSFFF